MQRQDVLRIESELGIQLPEPYASALVENGLHGDTDDHPEFTTDVEILLADNLHFRFDPEDLSEVRRPGIFGAVKFWLLHGSGKRLVETRRNWHRTWFGDGRIVIGCDLGEERYFIRLNEASPKVYLYEAETQRSRVVADTIGGWLARTKQIALEAESE
jgi:hypothetical protein